MSKFNEDGILDFAVRVDTSAMEKDMSRASNMIGSLGKKMGAALAASGVAFSLQEIARKIIQVRGEFQQLEVAFRTMLGSADKANKLMMQLTQTAASTPFSLQDVSDGAKSLLAYNVEANKVNSTLIRLGDIAAGLSIPLKDLVYLYGTTMTQGRLYTQDFNQFVGRGIPLISELAKQFNIAEGEVKSYVEAGKVGFPEVEKAIISLTSEGSKFGGLMEAQSKTISGQISNIEDSIDSMFNAIGKENEGIINDALSSVSYLVANYEEVGRTIVEVASVFGTYKAVLMSVIAYQKAHTKYLLIHRAVMQQAILEKKLAASANIILSNSEAVAAARTKMLTLAQGKLNKVMMANKYALIAAAVVALGYGIYKLVTYESDLEKAQNKLNDAIKDCEKNTIAETAKIDTLFAKLGAAKKGTKEYEEARKNILNQYGSYLDGMKKEISTLEDVEAAYKAITEAAKDSAKARAMEAFTASAAEDYGEKQAELRDKLREKLGKQFKGQKDAKGADLAETIYWKIVPVLEGKEHMTDELRQLIAPLERTGFIQGSSMFGGGSTYQYNEAQTIIDQAARNRAIFDKTMMDARFKFGDAPTEESSDPKKEEEVKNKKYWESYLKDQQLILEKMSEVELKSKEAAQARANIRKAQQKLKMYEVDSSKQEDETANRLKKIDDYTADVKAQTIKSELEIEQAKLNIREEGFEKEKEQIDLNFKRLMADNERRKQSMLDALIDIEVMKYQNKHPNATDTQVLSYRQSLGKGGSNELTEADLSSEQQAQLKAYEEVASEIKLNAQKKLYEALFDEYASYEERRTEANKKFDEERKMIEESPADDAEKQEAINVLEQRRKESIQSINDEEIAALQKSSSIFVDLFTDAADKSDKEIRSVIKTIESLLKYLSSTSEEDITPQFGFTAEQLKTLKLSPEQIKAITERVEELKESANKSNPFKSLAEDIKNLFKKDGDSEKGAETLEAKLKNLGVSASETADMIGGVAGELSAMFEAAGNQGAADAMAGVQDAMGAISNIGKGFAQGGLIGGIAAAAGEAIGFITKAFQANARHKAALKEIIKEATAQQRAYNLALYEEQLAVNKANTVFGTLDYMKAAESVRTMREMWMELRSEIEGTAEQQEKFMYKSFSNPFFNSIFNRNYTKLKDMYSGLADIQIKTGHKKTGLFGWGKGKDLFSSILDVYPELIDKQGNFNRELAQSILESREFKDEGKESLQYMIDLYDKVKEAYDGIKEYLTGIFGELGNTMSDALVDAFRNGTDAAQAFTDSVSKMLENIGQQMIFSTLFGGIIQEANDKMLKAMTDGNLTDEEKFNQYVNILDKMTTDVLGQQGTFEKLLEKYQQMAEEKGFDLWSPDESQEQSGTKKGFAAASQDSIDEMNGRFTGIQMDTNLIRLDTESISANTREINMSIAEMREIMLIGIDLLDDISRNTHELYEMNIRLGKIEKNTQRL